MTWLLVDDLHEEAETFAAMLSLPEVIEVQPLSVADFQSAISSSSFHAQGVLLDVDLSNEAGVVTTGPGLAQSIRNDQQARKLPSFPIVRFSAPDKIEAFIGTDTSSDDLFDLKVDKGGFVERLKRDRIRSELRTTANVYSAFENGQDLLELVALDEHRWDLWGHPELQAMICRVERVYEKALPITRVLTHPGLLIDEDHLAVRLAVDKASSEGWPTLVKSLDTIAYGGVGSDLLPRWWSKGLNEWWTDEIGAPRPLSGSSIEERHQQLSARYDNLVSLTMPPESLGNRPWRICQISMKADGKIVPVDPSKAVRLFTESTWAWMDPVYAALGPAQENKHNPLVSQEDLKRLAPLSRQTN